MSLHYHPPVGLQIGIRECWSDHDGTPHFHADEHNRMDWPCWEEHPIQSCEHVWVTGWRKNGPSWRWSETQQWPDDLPWVGCRVCLEPRRWAGRTGMFYPETIPDNKFYEGNQDGKHYWLTPPDLYSELNAKYDFDFDPCPYPLPDRFDGLTCEWGQRNYVNPPFGSIIHNGKKKGPTAWVRKAIEENRKGKLVVFVYPLDKWVLMLLDQIGVVEVRNLGDVKWRAIEDGSEGPGTGRHIACFVLA